MIRAVLIVGFLAVTAFSGSFAIDQACSAEPQPRPCDSYSDKERRFFNATSGDCDSFDWRTCTTGQNSFSDWQDCRHACVCELPPEPTPCPFRNSNFRSYFFNKDSNTCDVFPNDEGSCSRNGNHFRDKSSCMMGCVCSLPSDPGSGNHPQSAFFFNTQSKRCEEFNYNGEGGNANRFATEQQCKEQCLCGMPQQPGRCLAYFPLFFYNNKTKKCESFVYGGCQGNNNRFSSIAECNEACP